MDFRMTCWHMTFGSIRSQDTDYGLKDEMLTHLGFSQDSITFLRSLKCYVPSSQQIPSINFAARCWLTKYLPRISALFLIDQIPEVFSYDLLTWGSLGSSPLRQKFLSWWPDSLNHARFMATPGPTVHARTWVLKTLKNGTPVCVAHSLVLQPVSNILSRHCHCHFLFFRSPRTSSFVH